MQEKNMFTSINNYIIEDEPYKYETKKNRFSVEHL